MKQSILTVSIIHIFSMVLTIQAQNWEWTKSLGSRDYDLCGGLCSDSEGNLYMSGIIGKPAAIMDNFVLTVKGFNDGFIAKLDPSGNLIWARNIGGKYDNFMAPISESAGGITYCGYSNSIYVCGRIIGNVDLNSECLITTPNSSEIKMYVAKFNLDGNCAWIKTFGSYNQEDAVSGITITPQGKIYISGTTKYNATFDSFTIPNGGFLAQYDENGNCLWVRNIINGLSGFPYGAHGFLSSLNIYDGDIYALCKVYKDSTYFNNQLLQGHFPNTILTKLDSAGNTIWVRNFGNNIIHKGDLTIDNDGNLYLGLQFSGGDLVIDSDTIIARHNINVYFMKFNKNGTRMWIKDGGGCSLMPVNSQVISKLNSDTLGNLFATGNFAGNFQIGECSINSNYSKAMYVTRFDEHGNCSGVAVLESGAGSDILSDNYGGCIINGSFTKTLNFGSTILTSKGTEDIFIAKLSSFGDSAININSNKFNSNLLIYANPNTGSCIIDIPHEFIEDKQLLLYVYDNTGRLIREFYLNGDSRKFTLNLEELAKGIYNVSLSNGKRKYHGKIVFN
jgi:hypothetical protein